VICCFILSYPATDYVIHGIKGDIAFSTGMSFIPFTVVVFVLGLFMSFGKAAVYSTSLSTIPKMSALLQVLSG